MARNGRYANLEGGFWHSKKVVPVSMAARGLWATMLSYCADKVTDGVVEHFILPALCPSEEIRPLVEELKGAGLLEDHPDGFKIQSYEKHNLTRKQWESKKKADRQRKSKRTDGFRADSERNPEEKARGISSSSSSSLKGGVGGTGSAFEGADPSRDGMAVTDGTVVAACPQCGSPVVAKPSRYGGMWAPCTNRGCGYKIPKLSGEVLRMPTADDEAAEQARQDAATAARLKRQAQRESGTLDELRAKYGKRGAA